MLKPRFAIDRNRLIVAMDHGRTDGAVPGLEDPGRVIDMAAEAGADAIMTTFGVIKSYGERIFGRIPVFLRIDGGPSRYRESWLEYTEWDQLIPVEVALKLGVDGVVTMLFAGSAVDATTSRIVQKVAGEAYGTSLSVMVEALPCRSERIPDPNAPGPMADAARLGFEHGGDIIKTYYTGSAESFRRVVEGCPAPVLIAGGPKADSLEAALEMVKGSLDAGGRGIVFGRNIWQSRNPAGMIRAVRMLLDGAGPVPEAARLARVA